MAFQIQKRKLVDSELPGNEIGVFATSTSNRIAMEKSQPPEVDIVSMSQLVDAAKDGDSSARSEICRQVQGQLNHMANKQLDGNLRRKINPSDIVQATLTRMVQGFTDFRGSTSAEFYGWLNTILKHEVSTTRRDFHRQRRDIRREFEPHPDHDLSHANTDQQRPEARLHAQEKMQRFREVIGRLPPNYAEVIQLRSIEELPFEEVAERMGRSVNAVSKLWSRALIALNKELSKLDDTFSI